jgi:hypothetical protein
MCALEVSFKHRSAIIVNILDELLWEIYERYVVKIPLWIIKFSDVALVI